MGGGPRRHNCFLTTEVLIRFLLKYTTHRKKKHSGHVLSKKATTLLDNNANGLLTCFTSFIAKVNLRDYTWWLVRIFEQYNRFFEKRYVCVLRFWNLSLQNCATKGTPPHRAGPLHCMVSIRSTEDRIESFLMLYQGVCMLLPQL